MKGSSSLFYKTSFKDEVYKESSFLMPRAFLRVGKHKIFPDPQTQRRGISSTKKNGIIRLFDQGIPLEKRSFWRELPTNENFVDLCHTRDTDEESV